MLHVVGSNPTPVTNKGLIMALITVKCEHCGKPTSYYGSWDMELTVVCKDCAQKQKQKQKLTSRKDAS